MAETSVEDAASCRPLRPHPAIGGGAYKEPIMAKRNGNREAKKPKQEKTKAATAGSVSELAASAARPAGRKR